MRKNSIWGFTLIVVVLACFLLMVEWKQDWQKQELLVINVLDVGQGDSILIKTPDNKRVLIDGGAGDKVLTELSELSGFINSNIDYVIVTHADADHFQGIFDVATYYQPSAYYLNIPETNKKELEQWWKNESVGYVEGDVLTLGEVKIEALWPAEPIEFEEDRNSSSIVVRVEYRDFCGIFTGDAPIEVEEQLIKKFGDRLDCELLKVGHHGAATSSSLEFVEIVSPRVSVISVGENNRYNHPSEEVLERLWGVESEVLRTDQLGRIEIWTDGEQLFW